MFAADELVQSIDIIFCSGIYSACVYVTVVTTNSGTMSIAVERLDLVHVIDPRTDMNAHSRKQYGVMSSGNDNTYRQYPSTSFSNSSIVFQCNPPNKDTIVNRRVYKAITLRLTATGTSAGAGIPLLQCAGLPAASGISVGNAYYDAPRCQPLANIVVNENVSINGSNFNSDVYHYMYALQRYRNTPANQDLDMSMTPSMPDQSQAYADLNGFARNPLRGYGDNPLQCPRGGFSNLLVTRNDSTGAPGDIATVDMTFVEPVYVSPFLFGENEEEQGLVGVETMTINLQLGGRGSNSLFGGLVGGIWSHSPLNTATFTSVRVDVLAANILFNYITPDLTERIPPIINYSWYKPTLYQTQNNVAISAGAQYTAVQNSVTLSSIPNRFYLWISEQDSAATWAKTDSFFGIDQIQVTFENRNMFLSQATPYDLYQTSVRNGCNESYRQWTRDCGSVLCIKFGDDIALTPLQAAGLRGKFQFQVQVAATNLGASSVIPVLNVLIVEEGVATISNGQVIQTIGVLSEQDVLDAKKERPVKYKPSNNVWGGGFWDDVLSWAKRIGRAVIDVGKSLPSQYQPIFQAADPVAKAVGFGASSGVASGGKALSRRQMLKLLH